jgi:putative membrane protein
MNRLLRSLALAAVGLNPLSVGDAFAEWRGYGWGPCPGMIGCGGFGGIMMGIVWIGAIIVIVLLIRRLLASSRMGDSKREESALDILKKRYARGEINKEEFEEKRKDLG